ncbi:hypothetical protein Tco_0425992 [Tanacetum coccineum]
MLVQNQALEGESPVTPPELQPTPSTSQPNVLEPQTKLLQTKTPLTVSHEPQTEANIKQILPSPSIYQRKQRKTQKHRRAKKVTELPQTSVPLDLGVDEGMNTGGSPRRQETMGCAPAQTRSERVLKQPNEPPLLEGHTSRSGEGRMEYTFELMDIVPPTPHDSPLPGGYTPGSDKGRLKLEELMAMSIGLVLLDQLLVTIGPHLQVLLGTLNSYFEFEIDDNGDSLIALYKAMIMTILFTNDNFSAQRSLRAASKGGVEIRGKGKPPTKTQLRNMMITYLKNMVVPDKEETVDPEILSAKYPIVDWESQNLGNVDMEDLHVYVDNHKASMGNTSYHKSLFSMLRKFDRQDLVDLHRLVMKRFEDNTPEGYNLLLWGDLKIMFEPNAEDEIWSNQQDWTLISWKLYENCGVHTLLMDGTLTCFNMLVEKRYPLIKEMLEKMLN